MTDTSPSAQTATRGKRWRAAVPLATQMTRQTWRLLLAIGLGLSLAVMLAGAVPLFARVAITVGLRSFLTQNVDQANYRINGYKDSLSDTSFAALNATVTRDAQDQIGSYLRPSSLYDITTVPTAHLLQSVRSEKFLPDTLTLRAVDPARYAPLLHVVAGRLPAASSASIEVAITQDTAGVLNIPVQGFTPQTYAIEYTNDNQLKPIPIVIVGVIASPVVPNAQLWFDNTVTPFVSDSGFGTLYGLVSRSTIFAVNAKTFPPSPTGNVFIPTYGLYWYQETDPNSFSSDTLSDIQARFDRFQDRVVNDITNEGGSRPML